MVTTRTTTPSLRYHLKATTRRQVKAAGGLEAAAQITRVGKSELAVYQSSVEEFRFMPIDVAADLMLASGSHDILEGLAASVGCVVTPVVPSPHALCYDMAALGTHISVAFEGYAVMLTTRRSDAKAAARLDQRLRLLIESAADARAALQRLPLGAETRDALPCTRTCEATSNRLS